MSDDVKSPEEDAVTPGQKLDMLIHSATESIRKLVKLCESKKAPEPQDPPGPVKLDAPTSDRIKLLGAPRDLGD